MLYLRIYKMHQELPRDFLGQWRLENEYSFGTLIPGGFGQGNFTIRLRNLEEMYRVFEQLPEAHVVLEDRYGDRVYEGRISDSSRGPGGLISLTTEGYYVHATERLHGLIYSSPTFAHEIISDTIQLAGDVELYPIWNDADGGVTQTDVDLGNLDFTGDIKLDDVISKISAQGYLTTTLKRMFFNVWDYRLCYFVPEVLPVDRMDWMIESSQVVGEGQVSLNNEELFNSVRALYDDPNGGPTLTSAIDDELSQAMYGRVKEAVISVGEVPSNVASLMQQLFLMQYAYQIYRVNMKVKGYIRNFQSGRDTFPYMIRAGDVISIAQGSYDIGAVHLNTQYGEVRGPQDAVGQILQTNYSSDGILTLDFGQKPAGYDIIVERLGLVANQG